MGFGSGGSGNASIAGASDVALSNVTNQQVLSYDSTVQKWQNTTLTGGGGSPTAETIPAGSVLFVRYNTTNSTWPARPTNRNDVMVHWIGASDSTPPPAAVNGVDIWDWEG